MIRVLVMIAVTGFLVSVVSFSSAVAIGGPEIISDLAWNGWHGSGGPWTWGWTSDHRDDRGWRRDGAEASREMAWTGGDTLDIDLPADVTYTQAPGPGKLTITGPHREIEALQLDDGRLHWARHGMHWGDLTVTMTAPAVTRFDISGSGRLDIRDYRQDKLSLSVPGDATVSARGEAKSLALSIDGSGDTDLSELKVLDASVDIDGSGEAKLAPTGTANVNISGSGDVTLLTRPAKLASNVSGSGSIHQEDGAATTTPDAPSPPEPPARHHHQRGKRS
jgi:hypothetical protein